MPNDSRDWTITINVSGSPGPPVTTNDLPDWTQGVTVAGGGDHGAVLVKQAYQNVNPGSDYTVALDSAGWNPDGYASAPTITCPVGFDGYHELSGQILIVQPNLIDGAARYIGAITVNATDLSTPTLIPAYGRFSEGGGAASAGIITIPLPTVVYYLSAGDVVRLFLRMPGAHSGALQAAIGDDVSPYATFLRAKRLS